MENDDDEEVELRDVKAMYLVGIDRVYDASEKIVPFVRLARERGVKRIVVLSAWEVERGEARMMGGVHEEVAGGGADADCEDGERMVWPEWVVGEFFFRSFFFFWFGLMGVVGLGRGLGWFGGLCWTDCVD